VPDGISRVQARVEQIQALLGEATRTNGEFGAELSRATEDAASADAPGPGHRTPAGTRHRVRPGDRRLDQDRPLSEATERIRSAIADTPKGWRIALITSVLTAKPEALQAWPRPRYVPFMASVGLLVGLMGTLSKINALMFLGLIITIGSLIAWYRPDDELTQTLRAGKLEENSGLPIVTHGKSSMDWWGMIFCLTIPSVIYASFFYSYFYIRLYSPVWPQGGIPPPDLKWPGTIYALLALSVIPQYLAMRSFRAGRPRPARTGLIVSFLMGAVFLGLQFFHLIRQSFGPQRNAYGSLFYVISWLLGATVLGGLGLIIGAYLRVQYEGANETGFAPLQMERATGFWYYTVAVGVLVFAILFLSPYV
jgi:heme/copper-type cytochrome/quinol oxidase subunit 3